MLFTRATPLLVLATSVAAIPLDLSLSLAASLNVNLGVNFCDMSAAQMPASSTPLPSAAGLTLYTVALGRGTQNYTCDTSNPSAAPKSIGALATLYNVTCMAASNPALLSLMPNIALNLPAPTTADDATAPGSPVGADAISGHHYFIDDMTTPFFNLNTDAHAWGEGAFAKKGAAAAPATAMKGQLGNGDGAVAWLYLTAQAPAAQPFDTVYRLNTAGGNPPATCANMPATFEVQYAAEYWFWKAS